MPSPAEGISYEGNVFPFSEKLCDLYMTQKKDNYNCFRPEELDVKVEGNNIIIVAKQTLQVN